MVRFLIVFVALVFAGACSRPPVESMQFDKETEAFLYQSLAYSPVSATGIGYHVRDGVPLDEVIDDYSAAGLNEQRSFYKNFQDRMARLDLTQLDKEQRVDLDIMKSSA